MMFHLNCCRRATVWGATYGWMLLWRMLTPFLNIPLLWFRIARLSFFTVSKYLSVFILVLAGIKTTSSTSLDPRTHLPWLYWQTVFVWSQVKTGMPRFCHPWESSPKSCPFHLHSSEEINGKNQLVAVSIHGTHLAHTFWYFNFSINTLWIVLWETSGTKRRDHPESSTDLHAWFRKPLWLSRLKLMVSCSFVHCEF